MFHATFPGKRAIVLAILGAAALAPWAASAQTPDAATPKPAVIAPTQVTPPDTELLHNDKAHVYQRDYDAEMQRIPENIRGGFGVDVDRINTLLQQMLLNRTLANEARAAGVDKDPLVATHLLIEQEKLLAGMMVEREKARLQAEFDALPNMDQAAREQWLTQQEKFREPDQYKLTYILYSIPPHTIDEARAMAEAARAKIVAGYDMNKLAREQSEDPRAKANGGQLDWTPLSKLDPAFSRAVTRMLSKEGDLSQPVRQPNGFMLIRLDGKQPGSVVPFDKAKPAIIDQLRTAYVDSRIGDWLKGIRTDPAIVVNQPAVNALQVHIDEDEVRRRTLEAGAKAAQQMRKSREKAEQALDSRAPAAAPESGAAAPAADTPAPTGK
jgi:parvulin-like peptidyl-prolyl isomerase